MKLSRRQTLHLLAAAAPALALRNAFSQTSSQFPPSPTGGQSPATPPLSITPGPFTNTRASLRAYTTPDWFADAKFGIWAHWGPQSAIGDGDWYARNMYIEGQPQYDYHRKRFGPQSKVGYKDLIHLFTADQWDPEHLMDLYQRAGARYFLSMGVHHDNYDLWNSKYQPRWNSVTSGPRKDVVGLWAAAARKRGIRFGVSEHLSNSFDWFASSHLADTKGPYANLPYDGQDPAFADLYHSYTGMPANFAHTILPDPMGRTAPDWWKLQYFNRVKDLFDQHQPDLVYTDGGIDWEEYGLATVAELYNVGPTSYQGKSEAVYFSTTDTDCAVGTCVLSHERSVLNQAVPLPWQTATCIGEWHYKLGATYKSPKKVIDMLVDIVSKNGNLLLNIPLPASGVPDADELRILEAITQWTSQNGEAIFSTRPWKISGEGPAMHATIAKPRPGFDPNEGRQPDLTAEDIRFTAKGKTLYALAMGWPTSTNGKPTLTIASLATNSPQDPGKIEDVRLLGRDEPLRFTQSPSALQVALPPTPTPASNLGIALRINFA
ncbi:MAG: alpha-L-fucosidase [Acidobacteriaceae bacterium]